MTHSPRKKHARSLLFMFCMTMIAGVLIWAKLRLVTDIPRSAYADPQESTLGQIDPAHGDGADKPTTRDHASKNPRND